jgi:hypothetical protein
MSEPWASIERLFKPRDYKQLIKHVVRHLDWYLDPTQKPKPPIWQISVTVTFVIFGLLFAASEYFHLRFISQMGIWWYWGGVAFASWLSSELARYFAPHKTDWSVLRGFYRQRGFINSAEFFYYLIDAYSEQAPTEDTLPLSET